MSDSIVSNVTNHIKHIKFLYKFIGIYNYIYFWSDNVEIKHVPDAETAEESVAETSHVELEDDSGV